MQSEDLLVLSLGRVHLVSRGSAGSAVECMQCGHMRGHRFFLLFCFVRVCWSHSLVLRVCACVTRGALTAREDWGGVFDRHHRRMWSVSHPEL